MDRPNLPALQTILGELEALPDTDRHKASAIAKVKAQIEALKDNQ